MLFVGASLSSGILTMGDMKELHEYEFDVGGCCKTGEVSKRLKMLVPVLEIEPFGVSL